MNQKLENIYEFMEIWLKRIFLIVFQVVVLVLTISGILFVSLPTEVIKGLYPINDFWKLIIEIKSIYTIMLFLLIPTTLLIIFWNGIKIFKFLTKSKKGRK